MSSIFTFSHFHFLFSFSIFPLTMNGRRSIHRHKDIPTVSTIRKQQKKRLEKQNKREEISNNCMDHLSLHLKILRSSSITVDRSRVANFISHYAQMLKKYDTMNGHTSKALNLIFDDLFGLMALERDEYVLEKLLELVSELRGPFTWDILKSRAATETNIPLKIIEENSSLRVRYHAWKIAQKQLECMDEINPEISNRTVQILLDLLSKFRGRNGRITGEPLFGSSCYWEEGRFEEAEIILLLEIISDTLSAVEYDDRTKVCCNEDLMEIIFEALYNESEIEMRHKNINHSWPGSVLAQVLFLSFDSDRSDLRRRYEDELRMALMKMTFQSLEIAMNHRDITALVATNSSTLNKLAIRIKNGLDCIIYDNDYNWLFSGKNSHMCEVALQLLRYGLNTNTSELQRILGLGLLCDVARYYASVPFHGDDDEAKIFRDVLRAHPEWRESFRIATACANPISHTALLGQSIQPRRSNPALYIIIDEDTEMI